MRRFGQFLGRAAHRQPHDKQRLNATRPSAWLSARFEPLEQRQLLAANILASLQGNLASPSDVHYLQLTVNGGQSALIGLRMQGTGGSVDPDSMRVETLAGHTIAPVLSQADDAHGNDSVLLVDLAPGSYSVITKAENGTTGAYQVDVFLVGDLSGDGGVDDHEALWASGAVVQDMGTANYVTRLFYQSKGIDLSKDLYRTEIDTDFDGDCDSDDLGRINRNKGVCGISAELVGDAEAPAIQAALVDDTGRSATDGITSALAIAGTIHDDREIVAFRAGLDGMNPAAYVSVLAEVDAGGHFLFDQARLEAILGGSVANNGPHTLHLVAEDDLGNASATPYDVTFTLDTIAPAAPTGLDLLASSDRGFYDNDDVTADNTPTIFVEAEASALVRLSSSIDGYVGQAIAASPVSITTPTLSDGDHDFTATATDLAGNTSGVSAPLSVLIETVAPVVPTLDLAAASDTGTLGDRLTSLVSVTLVGLAEAQSRMTLTNTGASAMAGATGAFSIGAVPLSFGNNLLTVTSMDLAGNTSSFAQTIKQNNAPTAGAYGPIAVDEDSGAKTYDLVGVFTDVNLVAGDTLTLSIVGNTNPSLVTPSLTGTSGQVTNNSLRLTFGQDRNGTATITVRATDAAGEYADATIVVNVAPVNDAPVPEDTSVVHVEENQSVDVDLRARFKDVETADDNLTFQLVSPTGQFGLGTAEILADGHTLRFTPNTNVNGLDYILVKVTDTGEGTSPAKTITGTVIFSIDPFNDPPVANTTTLVTDEDVAVQVDLWTLTSDTETADANLSYALAGAAHGSVQLVDGHIARFTPAADYNGPASFTYTVTDTGDGTSPAKSTGPVTISVTVNPVNDTPVALPTTLTTAEDTAVTVDLRTLVSDVETADDALIFTVAGATHGTVELIDGHTARFTPADNYNGNGPTSFTYSVQDTGDGAAAAKTVGPISIGVTVTPVNDTPVALPTTLTIDEDAAVTVDLRTLVSDVETADDALIFTVAGATHGTVTLLDGHTARFQPADNYNGPATFTYSVTDTGDGTAAAKTVGPISIGVTVNPVNDAPVALPTALTTTEDTVVTVDLRTLVTDVETGDDALIFTVAGATNGTVELLDGHTARFTPAGNYNGPASFTYSVQDTGDGTAAAKTAGPVTIAVTVTPVNDAPAALPTTLTTDEDFAVEVDLRTLVSDVETADDALSFTVGGAANGAVQLVDGHIARFTPGANFNNNRGSASFTYSVTDTGDGTAAAKTVGPITISVSVTPVNDAPVTGDDSRAVANDEPTTINVLANDTDPDLVEGDTISIVSVTQGSRNGTVVIDNGKIIYTPVDLLGGEGTETFSYTIRDTVGLTATQVVTLTVVANSPPVAEPDTASTNEDAIIGGNVLTNDHDDDGNPLEVIAFDATSVQGAAVTVAADGTFSYNPTGAAALQTLSNGELLDDTFTYTISDGQGGTAIGTVTVHVTGMNDAPTATAKTGATDEDTTLSKPAGFLLDGAHDPDAHDTLSINVGASDATSAKGAIVTIQADGSFVYDPTGSTVLQGLAQGQSTTDTFLFTVDDGNGGQYSAVVTITVTGLNDQPTARADSFQTNEDTPLVADETRNVLDNDTDPDTTDVLTVVGADSVSIQGAAVTVHADGTFSYNPGSLFNHLAVGESAQDTFSYTMSDGHVTKTATVTVTITGVNDEPTAVADSAATGKSTVINIDVVDNDTDPDTSDVLVVGTFAPTSTRGATITKNGDGTLKYDPRGSVQLQALGTGQQLVDTFTYAVSDGHGGSSTATVSVTVTGSSDVLYVANPIADMTLTDATSPQPGLINLNTVFDAPDGVSLSFTATSSNEELVHVSIVGGNQLQVTYVTYTTGQDRTPAVVTVTATDNTPQANHVSDQFNVTVNPEDTVGVYLVVRQTATPVGQASGNTLPTSLDEVAVGSTYVVEVWMQDVYGASVTGGPSDGLTGGEFDISFNKTLGQATGLNFEGPYFAAPPFQTGTINNSTGLIDDFGSGVITKGLSVAPLYTRLGYTTFTASAAGTQSFTLSEPTVARFGSGNIDLSQLNLGSASVDQVVPMQSLTFTVSSRSTMQISGTVLGATLEPTSGSSDMAAGLTGTLQVLVDNPANPTRLSIASGSLDVTTNVPEGKFLPGPGGTDVPAYADFAFTAEPGGDLVQLALRELLISLSTDEIQTLSGPASAARFDASMIDSPVAAGFADVRSSGLGGSRVDLTGLVAEPAIDETGILNTSGTVYDLTFVYRRTIDLSAWFPNTVLTIDGTYVAEYDTAAGVVGTAVAAEAPTVAQMTVVKEPTTVDANGQVSALPESEAWIDEWDGYWVEVWVKTSEAPGITAGSVDLAYNPDYFTATEIDHGTVYVDGATGNLDQDGLVLGLGGIATLGNVGGAGYTLLGRVKFESLGDDGVVMDAENQVLAPHDLGLELSNVRIEGTGVGALDAAVGRAPQTEVWAVPYDVDDSGRIDLGDLSYFAATYRDDVLTSDTPFVWALDFDHTGSVDLGDLSFLASNYGLSRGGAADVVFAESFLQRWVGAGLDVQGETAVGDLLDAAIATWQDVLGLDQPIDIQLVVEDFGTSQLGQGQILEVDADGVPILGRVTIDDDANGLGWYSQLDSLPGEGQYDLYTVLLHEVGHTLGFMQSYEGFGSQVQTDAQGDTVFVGSDFTAPLDASGQHVDAGVLPDDAMTASLSPGVRKLPSELDARILLAAYEAASGGASGFAAMSAAMVADDATAATLAGSTSTADFDRLDGKLEGDVTWDRLLGSRSGRDLSATDAAAPTDAQADAVDALHESGLAADLAGSTRARHAFRVQDDSGDLGSDEILVELAATRDLRPDRPHTLDALFSEWDDFVVKDATNR